MLLCLTTATNIHPAIGALTSLSTHTMPTTHLQRRASNVLAIHLKESQPTTCLFVIIACIHQVHDGSQDLIKTHLSVRWLIQDVWSMMYEWFLKPQSAEELSAFSQLDCKCSTVQRNDVTHQIGGLAWSRSAYKTKQVHARWFMMELALLPAILCYTKELDENDERFYRLDQLHRRRYWPCSVLDILPHGNQRSIQGLLQWFTLGAHPLFQNRLYQTLCLMVHDCYPLVVAPPLMSPRFIEDAIAGAFLRNEKIVHSTPRVQPLNCIEVGNCLGYFSPPMTTMLQGYGQCVSPAESTSSRSGLRNCISHRRLLQKVSGCYHYSSLA
jgi:hypothetical protein